MHRPSPILIRGGNSPIRRGDNDGAQLWDHWADRGFTHLRAEVAAINTRIWGRYDNDGQQRPFSLDRHAAGTDERTPDETVEGEASHGPDPPSSRGIPGAEDGLGSNGEICVSGAKDGDPASNLSSPSQEEPQSTRSAGEAGEVGQGGMGWVALLPGGQ